MRGEGKRKRKGGKEKWGSRGWKKKRKEKNRRGRKEGGKDRRRVKKRGKGRREDDVGYEKGECRVAKVTPAL